MKTSKTRALIVDDHPLYLDGVTSLLQELFSELDIFQAGCGEEALAIAETHQNIDWIFLDYCLPDTNGLVLLRKLKQQLPSASIVMVSGSDRVALVSDAIGLGANGFISKSGAHNEYQRCLSTIESGDTYLCSSMQFQLQHYRTTIQVEKERVHHQISKRQEEVLLLVSAGYNNTEIARTLGISKHTVKDHVSSIMQLLNADNRIHCIAEARQLGLIH